MRICKRIRCALGGTLVALGVVGAVAVAAPVFATDIAPSASETSDLPDYRIQASPSKFDLELSSGKTMTETFQVQNTGGKEFRYSLSVAPYSVSDEGYTTDFDTQTKYTDLANWVTLSKTEGKIGPNESQEVTATIKVPNDVPAGGQYAAILVKMENDSNSSGTGVTIGQQVGILIYSNVDGETRRGGRVVENKISSFLFKPPVSGTSVIENSGNTHVEATYILQVYPLFSNEEVYTNEENPDKRVILPETKRYNTVSWNGSPQLGFFKVKQTVKILEETSVTEKLVFICPIWFLFIIILLVFCVIFWIINRLRGRNKGE